MTKRVARSGPRNPAFLHKLDLIHTIPESLTMIIFQKPIYKNASHSKGLKILMKVYGLDFGGEVLKGLKCLCLQYRLASQNVPFGETGICGFGVFPIWHFAIDINSVNAPKCCNLGQAAIFLVPGKTDFILLDVTLLELSQHPMHEMTKCQKYNQNISHNVT